MVSDVIPPPDGLPRVPLPPPAPWTRVDTSAPPDYFAAPYPSEPRTNILAIVGFSGSFVYGLVGIVCGHIALAHIRRTGERGRGLALAGAIIGYAQLALAVLWFAFVLVGIVIAGVASTSVTSSAATTRASPTGDCSTLEKASLTLSNTLTSIASSSWTETPAAAKDEVVAASNRFSQDTQTVSDDTLAEGIDNEQTDLAYLGSALVDYEAAAPGQGDAANVSAELTKTSDDLTTLTSACR